MTDTLDRYTISITKEELSEMPRVEYNGVVRVVDTAAEMKKPSVFSKNTIFWDSTRNQNRLSKKEQPSMFPSYRLQRKTFVSCLESRN